MCLVNLSNCFGQPTQFETYGNYVETLSHLDGVGVRVLVSGVAGKKRDVQSEILSQVRGEIRDARGVRLYMEKEINRSEESAPVLDIDVNTYRTPGAAARPNFEGKAEYEIEFAVTQDVVIKGSEKELRRNTYEVYGSATTGYYNTADINPARQVQRVIPVMVDQFVKDFREAQQN
jgi:hypothetical protein